MNIILTQLNVYENKSSSVSTRLKVIDMREQHGEVYKNVEVGLLADTKDNG